MKFLVSKSQSKWLSQGVPLGLCLLFFLPHLPLTLSPGGLMTLPV